MTPQGLRSLWSLRTYLCDCTLLDWLECRRADVRAAELLRTRIEVRVGRRSRAGRRWPNQDPSTGRVDGVEGGGIAVCAGVACIVHVNSRFVRAINGVIAGGIVIPAQINAVEDVGGRNRVLGDDIVVRGATSRIARERESELGVVDVVAGYRHVLRSVDQQARRSIAWIGDHVRSPDVGADCVAGDGSGCAESDLDRILRCARGGALPDDRVSCDRHGRANLVARDPVLLVVLHVIAGDGYRGRTTAAALHEDPESRLAARETGAEHFV